MPCSSRESRNVPQGTPSGHFRSVSFDRKLSQLIDKTQGELVRLLHDETNIGAYVEPARMTVGEFLERWTSPKWPGVMDATIN